ncbi:TylF/MycF/NovP-related O-methyltransferase [Sphingomonas sp.]|uniref:TylF/MycF/NovP-related O-methyltransferase n=1 Tax=Sphingomonas sp. TaxID=28214 RepID=UPI00178EBFB2|nr:TylF/MycF/NovP-related O-methyltransferase [Sphingomonas sp.]MBA3511187.1 class I SAM-dependent methyltransferase [Sphingomonas sp.]
MRTSLRYGLHPILPARLGFRRLLARTNPDLSSVLDATDPFALAPSRSRVTLARVAHEVLDRKVPGDFVEFGVHRGGTAGVLASILRTEPERTLHLFDRWGDLPEPTEEDGDMKVRYARDNIPEKLADLRTRPPLESLRTLMERMQFDRVKYYQGWYDDTIATYSGEPIAFASVDCDYYDSVKLVLDFIRDRASPGCVILVDDYGDDWPGAKKATDDFCARHGLTSEVVINQALVRF